MYMKVEEENFRRVGRRICPEPPYQGWPAPFFFSIFAWPNSLRPAWPENKQICHSPRNFTHFTLSLALYIILLAAK